VVASFAPGRAHAQESDASPERAGDASQDTGPHEESPAEVEAPHALTKLVIATKVAPPFAIKNDDGEWEGLSIELWERIADELNYEFTYSETNMASILEGLQQGRYDAGVAAITLTAQREEVLDFTHPFFTTGLGIAVRSEPDERYVSVLLSLFSWTFIQPMGALLLVLTIVGLLVWLFERKKNAEQFGGSVIQGIGSGFWWSAVTMTTVGYGDKAPSTLGGRAIGLVWMFASIITISGFTAAIASSLTVTQLGSSIEGPDDLKRPQVRVGSIQNTTSSMYLANEGISPRFYDSIDDGLAALETSEIDAFVYDAPILMYFINQREGSILQVLPQTFERQDYAIGLPAGSPYREDINRELLRQIGSRWWTRTKNRYLGQ
jgi:ABC-type amino acid transport substrate-binding protein